MNNSNPRWTEFSTISLPVLILVVTILDLVLQRSPSELIFDPPLLIIMLITVLVSGMAFAVTYVSARSYMTTGLVNIVLLGAGVLAVGTGCLGVWLRGLPGGTNLLVTTHNIGMMTGSVLCFASVTSPAVKQLNVSKLKLNLAAGYAGVLAFMGVDTVLAIRGAFPLFFIEGTGHTYPSQIALATSAILFAVSSNIAMRTHLRSKKRFPYWYSLARGLFAVGNFIFLFARFVSDLLGWGEGSHNASEASTSFSLSYPLADTTLVDLSGPQLHRESTILVFRKSSLNCKSNSHNHAIGILLGQEIVGLAQIFGLIPAGPPHVLRGRSLKQHRFKETTKRLRCNKSGCRFDYWR